MASFYDDLWNRWDDMAVDRILAQDFGSGAHRSGHDRTGRMACSPTPRPGGRHDFHNEVHTLVVAGNWAAPHLLYTATHDDPFPGVPTTGRRFSYAGAAFFTARNGFLNQAWVLGDLAGLRPQLEPEV